MRPWQGRAAIVTFAFGVVLTACSGQQNDVSPSDFDVIDEVSYNGSESLDVYVPVGSGPWPVVVILHGGVGGADRYRPLAEALASRGMLVMNVSWLSEEPTRRALEGVVCSVRFARGRAADWGGDPGNIVLVGHSLGAIVGSPVALGGERIGGDCPTTGASALPDAFVGIAGAYDPGEILKSTDPELYELGNPVNYVGDNPDLVTRLIHGTDDTVTPVERATRFHELLMSSGYSVSLTLIEGAGHNNFIAPTDDAFATTIDIIVAVARR